MKKPITPKIISLHFENKTDAKEYLYNCERLYLGEKTKIKLIKNFKRRGWIISIKYKDFIEFP
jgi:hypothetical protein